MLNYSKGLYFFSPKSWFYSVFKSLENNKNENPFSLLDDETIDNVDKAYCKNPSSPLIS